jgi:hypothetical protein
MTRGQLPEDVAVLLATGIDSVPDLEALLFFHRRPLAEWHAAAVADLLHLDRTAAPPILERLTARGFLRARDAPSRLYQYAPAAAELTQAVDGLAEVYAEQRLFVIAHLAARRPRSGCA